MKPGLTVTTHKSNRNPLSAHPIFFTLNIASEGASLQRTPRRMVEPGLVDPPQPYTSTYCSIRAAIIG